MIVFPIMYYVPRRVASRLATTVAATIQTCVAIYNLNHNILGFTCHISMMINFIKIHMTACSWGDTRTIPDPYWKSWFTERELYYAQPFHNGIGLFDWLNYMLFTPSIGTSCIIQYRDFDEFINLKDRFKNIPRNKMIYAAFKRCFESLLMLSISCWLGLTFDNFYMTKAEFAFEPFHIKLFYLVISLHYKVYSLFTAFGFMESSLLACGAGYKSDQELNSIRAANVISFEFAVSTHQMTNSWNMLVHNWLKYYVMLRLMNRKA